MKILILSDDFPPKSSGGAAIIAHSQALELKKRGHEVVVITTTQERSEQGIHEDGGVVVHRLYTSYPSRLREYITVYNPQIVKRAERIIREFKPDVVHIHNVHQFLSFRLFKSAKKTSRKVILTVHDAMLVHSSKIFPIIVSRSGEPMKFNYKISTWHQVRYFWRQWNPFKTLFVKNYLKYVDRIFAVSEALAEALRQNGITRVEVMHNGITTEDFKPDPQEIAAFSEKYKLQDKKVLFFGGRISRAKGGGCAVNLLAELNKTSPTTVLLVAGREDGYIRELKKRANDLGVSSQLVVTGWLGRKVMSVAYAASDIVLVLSIYLDPFPTINLEAMASKKPIIGTMLGGTPEIVKSGETGYIVNPMNSEEVIQKTKQLLDDPHLARLFGQNGYEIVRQHFSLSTQVDQLEKAYART